MILVPQQHRFDEYRATKSVQDKAWVAGNGHYLVKTHNAVLNAFGYSLRASYETVILVVTPFVKGRYTMPQASIPCKARLAANHFITRCIHQIYMENRYVSHFTLWVKTLQCKLHNCDGIWRCCNRMKGGDDHSTQLRLAIYHHSSTLFPVQPRILG